jgi:transposase
MQDVENDSFADFQKPLLHGRAGQMDNVSMTGCDLHDKKIVLRTVVGRGNERTMDAENTPVGRRMLISKLKADAAAAGCQRIVLAYEASGQGFNLCDELIEAGIECFVLAPTKIARSLKQKKEKTDAKDARQILDLLRGHILAGNELPSVQVPTLQERDDRELTRCRLDLADKQSRIKAQIKALLKRNGVERPSDIGKGWTKKQCAWLEGLTEKGLRPGAAETLDSLLRQIESVQKEVRRLDKKLAALAKQERHAARLSALTKLDGVALLSALVFLVEMGEMGRFANRRKVGSYIGLVPSSNETGESSDRKGNITRQGSAFLRRILCQCAWARMRTDPVEKAKYAELVERNPKKKKIAVVALMRRLAVRMWHAAALNEPVSRMKATA